jgi:hypothetical protein
VSSTWGARIGDRTSTVQAIPDPDAS